MLTHGIHPLLNGLFAMLHDDLALVAFDRHVGKALLVKIHQGLLITVVVGRTDQLFTESTTCHRLKISTRRIDLGDFFIVIFFNQAGGEEVGQALLLVPPY